MLSEKSEDFEFNVSQSQVTFPKAWLNTCGSVHILIDKALVVYGHLNQ